MYICVCKSVTDGDIQEAVDTGLTSFHAVQSALAVGTGCGTCACDVDDVIQERIASNLNMQSGSQARVNEIKLSL